MDLVAETRRFTLWEVLAGPLQAGSDYSLAFKAPNGRGVYVSPDGVTNAIERLDRWPLTPPPRSSAPDWAKGAFIYQIFPDRFGRHEDGPRGDTEEWGSPPGRHMFQGGDLPGVTERLGYLEDLGVDVIYLNPVFTSPSNHRYDTVDYYEVDPMLGGNEALSALIESAHSRRIRVILDASFNHVHPRFFAFADVMRHGERSSYWGWFVVSDWPLQIRLRPESASRTLLEEVERWAAQTGLPVTVADGPGPPVEPSYDSWYGVATMPRVDLSNLEARAYMLDVARYWPREFGIDGWRMDVTRYVDPDFWVDFRQAVHDVNPDAYLLCEVMGDASSWLQGDRFDAVMNYAFRDLCLKFFARDDLDGEGFTDGISHLWSQYSWPATLAGQNLLSSHDTPRLLTECGGEVWRARLATIFQFTFPGAPGVFYGDETGMLGGDDPENRGAFPPEPDHEHEIHITIAELARLRRAEPALRLGDWRPLIASRGMIAFTRDHEGRRLLVVINTSATDGRPPATGISEVIWGDASLDGDVITVAARSAAVFA
jgi:glycosidase